MEAPNIRMNAVASLTDDLVLQILRRLLARSLFSCKCVCRSWNHLITDGNNRKVLAQTMTGFFTYKGPYQYSSFTSLTGEKPSLSFLPFDIKQLDVVDCCQGLVLCFYRGDAGCHFVVCNPATKKFKELPPNNIQCADDAKHPTGQALLAFDPTASSHFHVFEVLPRYPSFCRGVNIYSSKSSAWIWKDSKCCKRQFLIFSDSRSVFLNGFMHIMSENHYSPPGKQILALDTEGNTWTEIEVPCPREFHLFLVEAQGHLCVCSVTGQSKSILSVWILEDYGTNNWTFKHTTTYEQVFSKNSYGFGVRAELPDSVIRVDLESNLIFFRQGKTILVYDMNSKKVNVIPVVEFPYGRSGCCIVTYLNRKPYYLPYVPLFSESLVE